MLAKIVLTLTITLGAHPTAQLDVTPTFLAYVPPQVLTLPGAHSPRAGLTLPYLSLVSTDIRGTARTLTEREELRHADQWAALGPGYAVAYGLTLGQPFEPYDVRHPPLLQNGTIHGPYDQTRMWMPPASMRDACPLLRFNASDAHESMTVAPCYVGLTLGR